MKDDDHEQPHHHDEMQALTAVPTSASPQPPDRNETPLNTSSKYHRPYRTGCLGCLSRIPGVSLASWLIIFIGCGGYVGGNLVWVKMVSEFTLVNVFKLCPFYPWFVIGMAGVTILLATKILCINHYASGDTSRHVLLTPGKNCSVRCCSGFLLMLAYIFQFIWIFLFTAHTIALLLLLVTTFCREATLRGCLDLRHYGYSANSGTIKALAVAASEVSTTPTGMDNPKWLTTTTTRASTEASTDEYVTLSGNNATKNAIISYKILASYRESAHICGKDLDNFTERSLGFFITIAFTVVGALFVLIGMLNLIICLAGNYKHVKEIRHLPYMVTFGDEYMEGDKQAMAAGM